MLNSLKEPDYSGLWVSKEKDFSLFYIWLKEKNSHGMNGKCWEKYRGELIESNISYLKKEELEISFKKKYLHLRADLFEEAIFHKGYRSSNPELFRGLWKTINDKGKKVEGIFHLADSSLNKKTLNKILSELYTNQFDRELDELQKIFSFKSII